MASTLTQSPMAAQVAREAMLLHPVKEALLGDCFEGVPLEISSAIYSAATMLAQRLSEVADLRFVVFYDEIEREADLVAIRSDRQLTLRVSVDTRQYQIVQIRDNKREASEWRSRPYDLESEAQWLRS